VKSREILGQGGLIAKRLENYEERKQQLEMADVVATAIDKKQHLIVEAGTGVGKSFGYLVPAILSLQETADSKRHSTAQQCHTFGVLSRPGQRSRQLR